MTRPFLLGAFVAVVLASAAMAAGPVLDDPGPDICATWGYGIVVVAWLAGVPALLLALASLRWRSLRMFAGAIAVGALVGVGAGVVIAQLELRELKADPSGMYCD